MRLLLIGATGSPYYEHCRKEITDFLASSKQVGVITAANLFDEYTYFRAIHERLSGWSPRIFKELTHIRWNSSWRDALNLVDALIIPGGNTYVLLKRLCESGLLNALRDRVRNGLPYIGSSAGANLAGPNILTTNDWNVVGLTHFEALGLVPFNINPHYVERTEADGPHSETRDSRIREYHQFWNNPVIGLEETAVLRVIDAALSMVGKGAAKVFAPDEQQHWLRSGKGLVLSNVTMMPFQTSPAAG
ncbi:MAG: dipeptidase PepE [Terriglobales bacterium]